MGTDLAVPPSEAAAVPLGASLARRQVEGSMRWMSSLLMVGLLNAPPAGNVRIEGRTVDQGGLALPGVTLVISTAAGAPVETAVSAGDGTFVLEVPTGAYRLEATLDGFQPTSLDVRAAESVTLPDLVLSVGAFTEETTVIATVPTEVQAKEYGGAATLAQEVIHNAPTRNDRYDDVLPLLPNVIRGPDGLISVAGARSPEGVVLMNGVPSSDVASGIPVAAVPLEAVESVQVITTGYPAEYGPSTGGVTVVNTRSGSDKSHFSFNSFIPRIRLADGGVRGVEAWNPKAALRGPIVPGTAWFAQSLDYQWEKMRAYTMEGTQDRKQKGFTSLTQVDVTAGSRHVLTGWLNAQRLRVDAEGLSAFEPLGTVPSLERSVWAGAFIDRAAFGSSTLETRVEIRHQDTTLEPDGTDPYVVCHDVTRGSYFHTLDRHALSGQILSVYSRSMTGPLGNHLFKAGGSAERRQLDGWERGTPVTFLRSNLVPARAVEFLGPGEYTADSTQIGAFVQDQWNLSGRLRIDLGFRADHDTLAGTIAAPRAGLTWNADDRTTMSAGAGSLAGDTPLAALAFDGYQDRRVTLYDESGLPLGDPITYRSVLDENLGRTRAWMWSARLDRRLTDNWSLRAGYQERRGNHEPVVAPMVLASGEHVALLSTTGKSHTRSLETTVGYRSAPRSHQLYLSYVRSWNRGNTNDFSQVEALFKEVRLDAPEDAAMPADVPHRLLLWGVFTLPADTTVAPFFDLRSGFPYSAINDDWSYAEPRFSRRYPLFASLDLVVNKIVTLPGGTRARVGVKLYNIAGRRNGRDIQANLMSPDFGTTYNSLGRQVRGVFEIMWGRSH